MKPNGKENRESGAESKGKECFVKRERKPKQKSRVKIEQKQKCWSASGLKLKAKSKVVKSCIVVLLYHCKQKSCYNIKIGRVSQLWFVPVPEHETGVGRYSGLVWICTMHKWLLAICWGLDFFKKGFHISNIVELRVRAHFFFFSLSKTMVWKTFSLEGF